MLGLWLQILGEAKQSETVEELITDLNRGVFGVPLDARQLAIAIRAFSDAKEVERGKRVFELTAAKKPELCRNPFVISALLMLYGVNHFEDAMGTFDLAVKAKQVCVSTAQFFHSYVVR